MKASLMTSSLATSAVLASMLALAAAGPIAPVEPFFALSDLDPYEACLFTCNLCFTSLEDTDKLLECSNRVCSALLDGKCALKEFMWIGGHCKHFEMVDRMWNVSKGKHDNKGYKLH